MLIAKNVEAGRLVAGFTHSDPGNWTSWPPHEHAKMLEEMYVYFDMPEPAYGIQLVYNNMEYPELVTVVREGDAVLMPSGYHPNVSVPGHRIAFLWAMAAHREVEDRQFGVVSIQPGFQQGGSGLTAGRKVSDRIKPKGADAGRDSDRQGRDWWTRGGFSEAACCPTESWHLRRALPLGHLRAVISRCNQELHGPAGARGAERPASAGVWLERDRLRNLVFAFQTAYALGMIFVGRLIDRLGTRIGYAAAMSFGASRRWGMRSRIRSPPL